MGDKDLGKNWHLRFRKIIDKLKQKNEKHNGYIKK